MTTPTLSHQTKKEKVQKTFEHKQLIAHNSETTSHLAKEPQVLRFVVKRVPIDKQIRFTTQKVAMEQKKIKKRKIRLLINILTSIKFMHQSHIIFSFNSSIVIITTICTDKRKQKKTY